MNEPLPQEPGTGAGETGTSVRRIWRIKLVTAACLLALLGLGVSIVHLVWPSPLMFALFMTLGQGAFGAAMVLYAIVIFADLKKRKVL